MKRTTVDKEEKPLSGRSFRRLDDKDRLAKARVLLLFYYAFDML